MTTQKPLIIASMVDAMAVCATLTREAVMAQGTNSETSRTLAKFRYELPDGDNAHRVQDWVDGYMAASTDFIAANLVQQRYRVIGQTEPLAAWSAPNHRAGQLETCFMWIGTDKPFTAWHPVTDLVFTAPQLYPDAPVAVSKGEANPSEDDAAK